jgi:hypothetical protein
VKSFVNLLIIFSIVCNSAFGACDWTTIKKNADGTYTYSEELHLCVGALVQANNIKDQQMADLTKTLTLKDLSIKESNERADLWSKTSSQLESRVEKLDSMDKNNEFIYFGAGVLATVLTGFMAARLIGK